MLNKPVRPVTNSAGNRPGRTPRSPRIQARPAEMDAITQARRAAAAHVGAAHPNGAMSHGNPKSVFVIR